MGASEQLINSRSFLLRNIGLPHHAITEIQTAFYPITG